VPPVLALLNLFLSLNKSLPEKFPITHFSRLLHLFLIEEAMDNESQPAGSAQASQVHVPADGNDAGHHAEQPELSDPIARLEESIAATELRLRVVANDLAVSTLADAAASRSTASSNTRNVRTEAQSLRDNLAALRETLTILTAPARSSPASSAPAPAPPAPAPTQPSKPVRPFSLPSGLPRLQRAGASAQTVHEFLTAFEDRLRAHNYPESRYVDALLTCCSKSEADWCRDELRDLTWGSAKDRFLKHFATPT